MIEINSLCEVSGGSYYIICGDFNTDLGRVNSSHTRALCSFVNNEGFSFCCNSGVSSVQFTYESKSNRILSCIDHIILSDNLSDSLFSYDVMHSGCNPSDHSMVYASLSIDLTLSGSHEPPRRDNNIMIPWKAASVEQLHAYREVLDRLLGNIYLPIDAVNCNDTICSVHKDSIESYHDKIVSACISASILTISKHRCRRTKVVPGWNDYIKLTREKAILWHTIWIQNDRPQFGIIFDIRQSTRRAYHCALRKIKNDETALRYKNMSIDAMNKNNAAFWREVRSVKGNSRMIANNVDGAQNGDVAELFAEQYNTLYNSVSYDDEDMKNLRNDIDMTIAGAYGANQSHETLYVTAHDVYCCIEKMSLGKSDSDRALYSDHLINGSARLFEMLATLFSVMLFHGNVPTAMNISTLVPIPKNNKKSLNDSANYRAIALSSVVGELMDNIIMSKYSDVFTTSDLQFGFKKKHSTTHCTFVANEVIHYYNRNGTSVNAVLLDASKAFDRVQYVKLFRLLLSRKLCPIVLRCLLNLYTNQQIRVRWCNFTTHPSGITNGVKQGGVLSPVLFTVYIDELLTRLGDLRVGCYVGNTFCGALSYADDILLLAPTRLGVRAMLSVCESFANEYHVIFNAEKSKLLVFPEPVDRRHFYFMGGEIEQITEYKHLGNYIGIAADKNNIQCTIGYFWAKINVLIREFNYVDFDVKYRLMKMFCMPLYGSPLWNLDGRNINRFYVAWRKGVRRLLGLPYNTHCDLIHRICNDVPVSNQVHKRMFKFIDSCRSSDNYLIRLCFELACHGSQSVMCKNMNFLRAEYGIPRCSEFDRSMIRYGLNKSCSSGVCDVNTTVNVSVIRDLLAMLDTNKFRNQYSTALNTCEASALLHALCTA